VKYFVIGYDPSSPEDGMHMPIVEAPDVVEAIETARGCYGEASIEFYDAVDPKRLRELAEYLEEAQVEISSDMKRADSCVDASHRCSGECCGWCASRKPAAQVAPSATCPCDATDDKGLQG